MVEVGTHSRQAEAGTRNLAEAADSKPPAAEAQHIALGNNTYTPVQVSEHNSSSLSVPVFSTMDKNE